MVRPLAFGIVAVSLVAAGLPTAPDPGTPAGIFSLDSQAILKAAQAGHVTLPLPLGMFELDLAPNPIAVGAVWGMDGVPMGVITETVTFKGTANGAPAYLAATGVGVFAMIMTPDPILVEPAWLTVPDAALDEHRVSLWSQNPPVITDEESYLPGLEPVPVSPLDGGAGKTARFLLEADFTFYKQFSLMGACELCALQVQQVVLSFANALWNQSDIGVTFRITSQWLCATPAICPYQDLGADDEMARWLTLFQQKWETAAGEPAHDVGHLMISTNLRQFVGFAGGLAGTPGGYSISEIVATTPPPILISQMVGLAWYGVVAHEVGHNFDARHIYADPIPPALVPTGITDVVYTIMKPDESVLYQFSDGQWNGDHNNRARIISTALARLP